MILHLKGAICQLFRLIPILASTAGKKIYIFINFNHLAIASCAVGSAIL